MTLHRRAELEAKIGAVNAQTERGEALWRFLAAMVAGQVDPLAFVLLAATAVPPACRLVLQQWRLGAIMADDEARERERDAIPRRDLRVSPSA